ncbi:LamG domain-containing protein [bacterium SCSIO 12741]|nr:LamG domain-containing protein [bacterium SCSIO 12741]
MRPLFSFFFAIVIGCFSSFELSAQSFDGFLSLDGKNDYVTMNDTFWTQTGSFTLEFAFETCNEGADLDSAGLFHFSSGLGLELSVQHQFNLATFNLFTGNQAQSFNSPGFLYSKWQHLALVYNLSDTSVTLFLNGTFLGQLKERLPKLDTLFIGKSPKHFFPGSIDEYRFSDVPRYAGNFPVPQAPHNIDQLTRFIFHLDDGMTGPATSFWDDLGMTFKLVGKNGAHGNGPYALTSDTLVCDGDSIELSASGGTLFHWSPADGLSDTTGSKVRSFVNQNRSYQVVVSDSNSCHWMDSVHLTKRLNPDPDLGPDTTICGGDKLLLYPGDFSTYLWSNATFDSTLNAGAGTTWVRVTDSAGCRGSDTIIIQEHTPIDLNIGNDTVVPDGHTFFLDAGPGFKTYKWSTGESTQKILVTLQMEYRVTVTDSNGCSKSDTINVIYTGLEELSRAFGLSYGPNPAQSIFTLRAEQLPVTSQFTWVNAWGQPLSVKPQDDSFPVQWDLTEWPAGFYYLRMELDDHNPVMIPVIKTANP